MSEVKSWLPLGQAIELTDADADQSEDAKKPPKGVERPKLPEALTAYQAKRRERGQIKTAPSEAQD